MPDVTITLRTIDESTKNTNKAAEGFNKLKSAAFALAAAGAVVGKFLLEASKQSAEAARSQAKLEGVLRSTGEAAGLNAKQLNDMAKEMERVNAIDADLVTNAQAVMLTFTKIGKDVFPDTMQAAIDMSAVLGGDLQGSVIQVSKAMNDFSGYTALKRAGVSFSEEQIKQISAFKETNDLVGYQNLLLNELSVEFGGVAAAIAEAGNGSERLGIAWGNMMEEIGDSSAFEDFNRGLTYTIDGFTKWLDTSKELANQNMRAEQGLAKLTGTTNNSAEAFYAFRAEMLRGEAMTELYRSQLEKIPGAADDVIKSLDGMAGSLEEISSKNADLINDAITIQEQQDSYSETQQEILNTITELEAEKATMRKGDIKGMEEINGKIDEAKEKYAEGAAAFVKAQQTKLAMMAIEKIAMLDGLAGFSEAEAAKALKILETADIAEAAAMREAIAFDLASTAIVGARDPAAELEKILSRMEDGYTIDVAMNLTGNAASFAGTGTPGGTSKPGGNSDVTPVANARGGWMTAGNWHLLGDLPGGRLTPYSELVSPEGEIFDAATTRQMYAMGLVDKNSVESHALGGMQQLIGGALKPKAKPWLGGSGRPAGVMVQPTETQAQSQDVAQNQQNQQNLIAQSNMQLESMFGELIVAVVRDSPRAIGKQVAQEMAKL